MAPKIEIDPCIINIESMIDNNEEVIETVLLSPVTNPSQTNNVHVITNLCIYDIGEMFTQELLAKQRSFIHCDSSSQLKNTILKNNNGVENTLNRIQDSELLQDKHDIDTLLNETEDYIQVKLDVSNYYKDGGVLGDICVTQVNSNQLQIDGTISKSSDNLSMKNKFRKTVSLNMKFNFNQVNPNICEHGILTVSVLKQIHYRDELETYNSIPKETVVFCSCEQPVWLDHESNVWNRSVPSLEKIRILDIKEILPINNEISTICLHLENVLKQSLKIFIENSNKLIIKGKLKNTTNSFALKTTFQKQYDISNICSNNLKVYMSSDNFLFIINEK